MSGILCAATGRARAASRWRCQFRLRRRARAHPADGSIGYTVLMASGQKLEARKIFDSHCPWKGFLAQQVYEALTKIARSPSGAAGERGDDRRRFADERRWNVTSDGFQVTFDRNEVASNSDGEYEATIAWSRCHEVDPAAMRLGTELGRRGTPLPKDRTAELRVGERAAQSTPIIPQNPPRGGKVVSECLIADKASEDPADDDHDTQKYEQSEGEPPADGRRDKVFGGREFVFPVRAERRRVDVDAIFFHDEPDLWLRGCLWPLRLLEDEPAERSSLDAPMAGLIRALVYVGFAHGEGWAGEIGVTEGKTLGLRPCSGAVGHLLPMGAVCDRVR
ncbi:MAG: DUF3298 domain-containing protein [Acidobacteriaceae bacterium]|nr:DUF3298 domain-containing protein [Acidobacteriaceae bacterium]